MTINPVNLRNTAWILALIFAVYGVFLIVTMFAFAEFNFTHYSSNIYGIYTF